MLQRSCKILNWHYQGNHSCLKGFLKVCLFILDEYTGYHAYLISTSALPRKYKLCNKNFVMGREIVFISMKFQFEKMNYNYQVKEGPKVSGNLDFNTCKLSICKLLKAFFKISSCLHNFSKSFCIRQHKYTHNST